MKNKILTALISLGVALGLWLYVVTVVSPNSDKTCEDIPVTLLGEVMLQDRKLMVTTQDLPSVTLKLEGNRIDLNKLNSNNISITVDLSRIDTAGTHELPYTHTFPGDVPNNSITVLNRQPETIRLTVEDRVSKSVPVNVVYQGSLSEDYMADKENKTLDYEHVNIAGPKSVVDQIAMARIEVDLESRSESISEQFEYTLCNEKGEPVDAKLVTTDVGAITMTLRIVRVKEIALEVEVIEGGGASIATSQITIDPQTIRISGSDTLLEGLDSLVLGTIDLSEMAGDQELVFPIKLPEGVTNETGVLEATVTVQFPDLETKVLKIKQFEAINVPEGLSVDMITKVLEIQIRGPKSKIKKLSADDVVVTVDFSEEQKGTVTVKAEISVNIDGAGAVGTYNITARLRSK